MHGARQAPRRDRGQQSDLNPGTERFHRGDYSWRKIAAKQPALRNNASVEHEPSVEAPHSIGRREHQSWSGDAGHTSEVQFSSRCRRLLSRLDAIGRGCQRGKVSHICPTRFGRPRNPPPARVSSDQAEVQTRRKEFPHRPCVGGEMTCRYVRFIGEFGSAAADKA
jgi:hypothetical protein